MEPINTSGCPAIDQLIESSKSRDNEESEREHNHLRWIPYSKFTNVELIERSNSNQPTYYATYGQAKKCCEHAFCRYNYYELEMLLLGDEGTCTQESIREFARAFSLPTHKYDKPPNI